MDIKDKVAVVTGGASGLGQATVELYAELGARVAIFDTSTEQGEEIAARLGEGVVFHQVDVTSEEAVQRALDAVVEKFGALHIANNYAGIGFLTPFYTDDGPHSLAEYIKVVNINQVGTFNVSRLAAEKMIRNDPVSEEGGRGVIINTSSVAAYDGQMGQVAYAATKGAIISMTLPMARDLAPYGIRVNTLVPGLVHTPMFDVLPEPMYKSLVATTVFPKRLGKTGEIAKLTAHIVDNDYINGESIRIDAAIRLPYNPL